MTPNGELYYNPKHYRADYSKALFRELLVFMHEMVHVWQFQLGYPVKWRGAVRIGLSYQYTLEENKTLSDYNMEAQGNILADYWAIVKYKNMMEYINETKHTYDRPLFEKVLAKFLLDPSDKTNLP